jgi:hypothetical protein
MIGFFNIARVDISRVWGSWSVMGCSKLSVMVSLFSLGLGSQIENGSRFSRFLGKALWFHFTIMCYGSTWTVCPGLLF